MRIRNLFKVDPLKSFTELAAFRFTILIAFVLAVIFTLLIVLNSDIVWKLDYVGFNSFVEIFQVPLSILAIAITVIAILATMHRSAQTKEQILIANKQNSFSNYYKHIEEFEKYMNNFIKSKDLQFGNLRHTHNRLFPKAFQGNYNISIEFIEKLTNEFLKIENLLIKFNEDRKETILNLLYQINKSIDYCYSCLDIKILRSGSQYFEQGEKVLIPSNNIKETIEKISNAATLLINILAFDRESKIPNPLLHVANLSINIPPKWDLHSKEKYENFIQFH